MASKVPELRKSKVRYFIHNIIYKYTLILNLLNDIIFSLEKYYPKHCRQNFTGK